MGFKNPNVVKTIVLPVPTSDKTEKEYFDEYGINIRDIFTYDKENGLLVLKERNANYLLFEESAFGNGKSVPSIFQIIMTIDEDNVDYYRLTLGAMITTEMVEGSPNLLLMDYRLPIPKPMIHSL